MCEYIVIHIYVFFSGQPCSLCVQVPTVQAGDLQPVLRALYVPGHLRHTQRKQLPGRNVYVYLMYDVSMYIRVTQ